MKYTSLYCRSLVQPAPIYTVIEITNLHTVVTSVCQYKSEDVLIIMAAVTGWYFLCFRSKTLIMYIITMPILSKRLNVSIELHSPTIQLP